MFFVLHHCLLINKYINKNHRCHHIDRLRGSLWSLTSDELLLSQAVDAGQVTTVFSAVLLSVLPSVSAAEVSVAVAMELLPHVLAALGVWRRTTEIMETLLGWQGHRSWEAWETYLLSVLRPDHRTASEPVFIFLFPCSRDQFLSLFLHFTLFIFIPPEIKQ